MQYILLNIVHPTNKTYLPLQIPLNWTSGQLLQYLAGQGFMPPGSYVLFYRNGKLFHTTSFSRLSLHPNEALHVVRDASRLAPHFGGRGNEILMRAVNDKHPIPEDFKSKPNPPKPAEKGLLGWLISLF